MISISADSKFNLKSFFGVINFVSGLRYFVTRGKKRIFWTKSTLLSINLNETNGKFCPIWYKYPQKNCIREVFSFLARYNGLKPQHGLSTYTQTFSNGDDNHFATINSVDTFGLEMTSARPLKVSLGIYHAPQSGLRVLCSANLRTNC